MKTTKTKTLLLSALLGLGMFSATAQDSFGSGANAFSIDFVTIGNPGNPDDTGTTGLYHTNHGGVGYTFRMGTYEISRDQILKANAAGGLGITLADMTSWGGNGANRPATGVSWNEAARFVNWLNTSSGFSAAYKFALQPGDEGYSANSHIELWTVGDPGYDPNNLYRNANAFYFLPSEDEWYKAAYYSGTGSTYYDYALGSNGIPGAVTGGTTVGTAVYGQTASTGPADVANAGGLSPYGVMGMNGNAWEWYQNSFTAFEGEFGIRGGAWFISAGLSEYWLRSSYDANFMISTEEGVAIGFRVASLPPVIPEPGSLVLAAICFAACGLGLRRRTRRGRKCACEG